MTDNKMPMQTVYRMIGARVEKIRNELGWTQLELSKKIGLTRASVANIETGRQRLLVHQVEDISGAFGMSPKALLRGIWT